MDLEARIRLPQKGKLVSALVTSDAAKAYNSVEHGILLNKLARKNLPTYHFAWIREFLADRAFFCTNERLSSVRFPQTRGVPQGSVYRLYFLTSL